MPDEVFTIDEARKALVLTKRLKDDCVKYIAQCDAGTLFLHDVAAGFMMNHLVPLKSTLTTIATVENIFSALSFLKPNRFANAAAAQTAFTNAQTAINNMILFLESDTGIPKDASRRILTLILSNDGSGTLAQRTITNAGQLATFKTQLETLRDS